MSSMSKTPRAQFALAGGRFPLDTEGRVAAAPGLAAYSQSKGNISAAQEATVDRKAAAARSGFSRAANLGAYHHKPKAMGAKPATMKPTAMKPAAMKPPAMPGPAPMGAALPVMRPAARPAGPGLAAILGINKSRQTGY